MKHQAHAMHAHSLAAHRESEPTFCRRALHVLAWVRANGPATDRQVMKGLGFADPNAVRPRITELVEAGMLEERASVKCPTTGKTVRTVAVPPTQGALFQ